MKPANEMTRWRETSHDPSALGARAADLVDAARDVAPLAPDAVARIKVAVLQRRPSRSGHRLPLAARLALLAVLVLASVATAKGTIALWRRHVAVVVPLPPPARPAAPARPHARVSSPENPAPVAPAVVEPVAPVAVEAAPPLAPAVRPRRTALATPARPRVVEAPATEAQLLSRALSRLRQDHDPPGALAALDQYARAFPHGILASEALSARLEAVIQMDDRRTALRLLDRHAIFAGRLGAQLLLTRAELRASAGRYGDALGDFDRLLTPGAGNAGAAVEAERALYGRAVCLGHLGQDDRARIDLAAYQRRFPGGLHAAEVARLLKGAASETRP